MNPRKDLSRELAALQERLGTSQGKKYWRTLEELADDPAFQELVRREFPEQADVWPDHLSRRRFLTLMGASLALAGVGGCSVQPAPPGQIVPYVHPPEEITPGKPLFYATAMTVAGQAVGLLVESHLGRPTKIEGNPNHPSSLGSTDLFNQAAILELYDPDRSKTVTHLGQTRTWDEALATLRAARDKQFNRPRAERGAGLRLLTGRVVSPTLAAQIAELRAQLPAARWHQYEPMHTATSLQGAQWAFGTPINVYHDFTKANVILSLDADFLTCGPGRLHNVHDYMERRRVVTQKSPGQTRMNRLYVVETNVSSTGAKADHRLALRAWEIEDFTRALASRLGIEGADGAKRAQEHRAWIEAIARDLEKAENKGKSVVHAGERQPAVVHLLVHRINEVLGNVGKTVLHTDPIEARPVDELASLDELLKAIDAGQVEMLGIIDCNPVFTVPPEMRVTERLQKVPLRIHLGLYQDETARQCHWHLPQTHFLEEWSDTRAFDGRDTIVQPLIQSLYQGRSAHEILSVVATGLQKPGYEIVRAYWEKEWRKRGESAGSFEDYWQESIHDGIAGDKQPHKTFPWKDDWQKHLAPGKNNGHPGLELVFQPDPTIYDGRFANNAWLQELPKPITKLTWDNAAIMSPNTARELKVSIGGYAHGGEHGGFHTDVVELKLGDQSVKAPVWIVPGHADGSITVYLGYGREYAGRVGGMGEERVGFNAYQLRTVKNPWFASELEVRRTGDTYPIACTQQHQMMEGREPVREAALEHYRQHHEFVKEKEKEEDRSLTIAGARKPLTMYDNREFESDYKKGHQWGMVIDLTTCTGCQACVIACQAENNIPVVGKDQVLAGREMHWLRIDRYSTGPYERPEHYFFQPIPCMHCENAPCEYVCPVEATVHSADGLNDMIYQRCVGTRFCSNNCPYKVRRFNFFKYSDFETESRKLQYNPDVTVRSRGVMEKCSYCVQRIRHAEIEAQVQNERAIADMEILTACQAVCPAQAIVFGNLNDEDSTVRKWHDSPLNYELLGELNTRPRTTYLGAVRNPNPDLERLERKAE